MTIEQIEQMTQSAKVIASEQGRTSRVGVREMYRLADKRVLTVCRDSAQNGRIVEWRITTRKPRKWNVSTW
jgi:uncharacterized membrane protein YqiK